MQEINFRGWHKGVMHVSATLDDMLTSAGSVVFSFAHGLYSLSN